MLFPNQIFSNAAKLLFGLSLFRKLFIKGNPAKESQPELPEYLKYPNLSSFEKNFREVETGEKDE